MQQAREAETAQYVAFLRPIYDRESQAPAPIRDDPGARYLAPEMQWSEVGSNACPANRGDVTLRALPRYLADAAIGITQDVADGGFWRWSTYTHCFRPVVLVVALLLCLLSLRVLLLVQL